MSSPERGPDSGRDIAAEIGRAGWQLTRWLAGLVRERVVDAVGGPARARVVTLFACVLALSSADTSTIGSIAPQLESSLHITNLDIALLSSATLLVGAIFVIPFGLLVDRARRVPILAVTVVLWSVASFASAIAGSYSTLLLTRLVMGAVTASAGPAIASLTGDYFPSRERGRIYAYILGGEIAGTAVGFTFSGLLASISWRIAFVALAIPGLFLAHALWSTLPEPRRGGQSRLSPGVVDLRAAVVAGDLSDTPDADADEITEELAHQRVRERGVEGFVAAYGLERLPERWRETIETVLRQRIAAHRDPLALADALEAVPRSRPFEDFDELAALDVPALVVGSRDEADPGHPLALARRYAEAIAGARFMVEEEGRSPIAWQGGQLSRLLLDFR